MYAVSGTFPIMLNLGGRRVVVVGAGPVGLRRLAALRDAGARVRLICPRSPEGTDLSGVEVIAEPYRPEHLAGAAMALACTNDAALNARVGRDARQAGVWANAADQPADCDFFMPATVRDGDVVLAAGTGGSAPALTGWLKQRLADALPERVGEFAAVLGEIRRELASRVPDARQRHDILRQLAQPDAHRSFCAEGPPAVRRRLEELLREQ